MAQEGLWARLKEGSLLVVKVGSSTVAEPSGELCIPRLRQLVDQVAAVHGQGRRVVLVSSGAIAAGMGRLGLAERPEDMAAKQALAAVGQGVLMETYARLFGERGLLVAQILVTAEDLRSPARRANVAATFARLLSWQVVPVVNENDTVATEEIRVGDNDTLSARVAVLLQADALVLLTDVDGLYTADPRRVPQAVRLDVVDPSAGQIPGGDGAPGRLGTGGMRTKLLAARLAGGAGIPTVIADGARKDALVRLVAGQAVGTLLPPPAWGATRRGSQTQGGSQ